MYKEIKILNVQLLLFILKIETLNNSQDINIASYLQFSSLLLSHLIIRGNAGCVKLPISRVKCTTETN